MPNSRYEHVTEGQLIIPGLESFVNSGQDCIKADVTPWKNIFNTRIASIPGLFELMNQYDLHNSLSKARFVDPFSLINHVTTFELGKNIPYCPPTSTREKPMNHNIADRFKMPFAMTTAKMGNDLQSLLSSASDIFDKIQNILKEQDLSKEEIEKLHDLQQMFASIEKFMLSSNNTLHIDDHEDIKIHRPSVLATFVVCLCNTALIKTDGLRKDIIEAMKDIVECFRKNVSNFTKFYINLENPKS